MSELPRTPHEAEQIENLAIGDFVAFRKAMLAQVQLYADTEAGRSGMGSPVLAQLVLGSIERDIDLALRSAPRIPNSPDRSAADFEKLSDLLWRAAQFVKDDNLALYRELADAGRDAYHTSVTLCRMAKVGDTPEGTR